MSFKNKTVPTSEVVTCEKYINKMLKNEKLFNTKKSSSAAPGYPEKQSNMTKPVVVANNQRFIRQRTGTARPGIASKPTPPPTLSNKPKEGDNTGGVERSSRKHKSTSRCRSLSSDRESWGQILHKNLSKDKFSSFSIFDPLRTVHFLSKELHNKLQTLLPDDDTVIQMISDIQQALKRIPSEVTSALPQEPEKFNIVKPPAAAKNCQTPPTLYQEDTEKFKKIMEENTLKLEASCQQLEMVCMNLQREKEITEKELEEAKENVEMLCRKVRDLEQQMTEITTTKIQELENEKEILQLELEQLQQEKRNGASVGILKKHIEELQKQKITSEEKCTNLEYEMTMLKMEKEKFVTMLSVRDREIKDIQQEMHRIQEQVNQQLKKLNVQVTPTIAGLKSSSDPCSSIRENIAEVGDGTISSINTNDSDKEQGADYKKFPCGDTQVTQDLQDHLMEKLSKIKSINSEFLGNRNECTSFEELLKGLSPSCRTLLTSSNH